MAMTQVISQRQAVEGPPRNTFPTAYIIAIVVIVSFFVISVPLATWYFLRRRKRKQQKMLAREIQLNELGRTGYR